MSDARRQVPGRTVIEWVVCVLSLSTLAMLACTWKLWIGQSVFPQVPLLRVATMVPSWIDTSLAVTLAVSLVATVGTTLTHSDSGFTNRVFLACSLGLFTALFVADQHRLQPWAYHFVIAGWACLFGGKQAIHWLRVLTISIYFFSAIGKIDSTFARTIGTMLMQTLAGWADLDLAAERSATLAWSFPLAELLIAAALAIPRTRGISVMLASGMHIVLILLLGPLGLGHRPPVLLWNVSCILQVNLLFGGRSQIEASSLTVGGSWFGRNGPRSNHTQGLRIVDWLAMTPVMIAIALPVLEPFGLCDSWLAWGLYSRRHSRVEFWIARPAIELIPESIQAYCASDDETELWVRCATDRWSLDSLQAPVYPHERFHLGVAQVVGRFLGSRDGMLMLIRYGTPNRWTGETASKRLPNLNADALPSYWLNAQPRRFKPLP